MISMTQWNNSFGRRKVMAMSSRRGSYFFVFYLLYFIFIKISNYPLPNLIIIKNKNTKKSLDISFKSFVFKDNFTILPYLKNIRISNFSS